MLCKSICPQNCSHFNNEDLNSNCISLRVWGKDIRISDTINTMESEIIVSGNIYLDKY